MTSNTQKGRPVLLAIIMVVAIFILLLLGSSTTTPIPSTSEELQPTVSEGSNMDPTPSAPKEHQPAPSEPVHKDPRPARNSIGDGTHIVGTDIEPGTYRSQASHLCYWARLSGFGGQIDDILANGNSSPEIVSVATSDVAFETSGCGRWLTLDDTYPATPATSFHDGTYEVGTHISPGTYRADGGPEDLCYWARLSGFSHAGISNLITNGNLPTVIKISQSDRGFTTFGCGNWAKI